MQFKILIRLHFVLFINMQQSAALRTHEDDAYCLHAKYVPLAGHQRHSTVCFGSILTLGR
jgi:hypothetical protein